MLAAHKGGLPPSGRWRTIWRAVGATGDEALYHDLIARYEDESRHYHTTRHLEEMFALWPLLERLATHPAEVELAIWYHDAIYQSLRTDNDRRSADLARDALTAAGADPAAVARVHALILATKHDAEPAPGDAQLLVDLDLAILGASPERFDEYEHQVRAEFAYVPVTLFRRKRREILESFLARPVIYHAAPLREGRERAARANLARSIESLSQ